MKRSIIRKDWDIPEEKRSSGVELERRAFSEMQIAQRLARRRERAKAIMALLRRILGAG